MPDKGLRLFARLPVRHCVYVLVIIATLVPRMFMDERATMQCLNHDPSSQNAITFITCAPPVFSEEEYRRYRLAATSWLLTDPKSRVVIFTGSNTTRQDAF
jgi:hypothetical protein